MITKKLHFYFQFFLHFYIDFNRIPNERRWYICKIHKVTQAKYEIIELLSKEYSIKSLCEIMKVSRSGYYKWLKNKDILNNYEINRKKLGELIVDVHKRKPSYGYHRINKMLMIL